MPASESTPTRKTPCEPPVSHVLHAKTTRVGDEVHVTIRMHHDARITMAFSPRLAAQVGQSMVRDAKKRLRKKRVQPDQGARLPLLKPCGALL